MQTLKANELRVGDIVNCFDGEFSHAIVKQVTENFVTFYRPYATTANDVVYAGNQLICLVGIEEFQVWLTSTTQYQVLRRQEVR